MLFVHFSYFAEVSSFVVVCFRECVALQDPYCAWDLTLSRCVARDGPVWTADKRRYLQNVARGVDKSCPHSGTLPQHVQAAHTLTL